MVSGEFQPGGLPFAFVDTDADKKLRVFYNSAADSVCNKKGPRAGGPLSGSI
jgi:hypothetical protein